MTSRRKADADNPEWTREDFANAKAPEDVLPADTLAKFRKHRGPQKDTQESACVDPTEPDRPGSLWKPGSD